MSLHVDLLEQATHLTGREPKRPKQASLRRAVSSAYYALFHYLVDEATRYLIGGGARFEPVRNGVARSFEHRKMKQAAESFIRGNHPWSVKFGQPREVLKMADVFLGLQQERHDADYNRERNFFRTEAEGWVRETKMAIAGWKRVRGQESARALLAALASRARQ